MILTTNITSATETSTVTPKRVSFPKTVTGPATNNTSSAAVYKLTDYTYKYNKSVVSSPTASAQTEFDTDKENIKWILWVDGGLMDGKKDYVIIENKALTTDAIEDFAEETDKIKFIKNIKDNGYIQATSEVVVEGGNKINKLTIKFSKWLDGKNVYVEAYRNGPDHNASKAYVKTTAVSAAPEILEVYWLDAQGKKITSTGYSAAVNLGIKTLGLIGENLTLSLYDYDSSVTDSDLLQWNGGVNSHTVAIAERLTFVPYNVEAQGAAAYANAFGDEFDNIVEVFVKIDSTNTTLQPTLLDQYARIDFTPEETANVYIATKKKVTVNGNEVDQYNALTNVFPGMKAYLVVETTNLNGTVSFSVTENTPLVIAASTKLPLLEGTTEKTDFTATITDNFAAIEVKFQELDSAKYDLWNTALDTQSEEGLSSSLILKTQIGADEYTSTAICNLKSSVIRYVIDSNGITKYHREISSEARYIFKESSGTLHYLLKRDFTTQNWVQKDKKGRLTENYIYKKDKINLVKLSQGDAYSSGTIKYKFLVVNSPTRKYIDSDCLACLLAAMIENQIEDLRYNGFSTSTGTAGVSSSHWNGMVGDLGYLNTNKDGSATWLSSSSAAFSATPNWSNNADFDYTRQVSFNNSLHKYGFSKYKRLNNGTLVKMLSENFVRTISGTDQTKLLPHTKHFRTTGVFHFHHLHLQGLDLSFFTIKE